MSIGQPANITTADLTSRYFVPTDLQAPILAGVILRDTWWSRPYEYAWASQFAGPGLTVLDAGCGVSHPFKWHLASICGCVEAIDTDRLLGVRSAEFWQAMESDLGKEATYAVLECGGFPQMRCMDMCAMDYPPASFDRVFCVSVLEHLPAPDVEAALREFARVLKPAGLAILTMDVPTIDPPALIRAAAAAGLEPAGDVTINRPPEAIHSSAYGLWCFRLALRRASATCA